MVVAEGEGEALLVGGEADEAADDGVGEKTKEPRRRGARAATTARPMCARSPCLGDGFLFFLFSASFRATISAVVMSVEAALKTRSDPGASLMRTRTEA